VNKKCAKPRPKYISVLWCGFFVTDRFVACCRETFWRQRVHHWHSISWRYKVHGL